MSKTTVKVISETPTGRNTDFLDTSTGAEMTRAQFVKQIHSGHYDRYYVRRINGILTPVAKPDGNTRNNLG